MTEREFDDLCLKIVKLAKEKAPFDTGNLSINAIKYEYIADGVCRIYVDGELPDVGVAPYMTYTNEPWLSPKWKGKKNPNENWWDKLAEEVAELIARETGSKYKEIK